MELETWTAPPGDRIPNHPRFPVLVYRGVEEAAAGAGSARALFAEHGWGGSWVDGVFPFHHFHSTSHEVLAVVAGRATLELGGPQGEAFEVAAGDVVVLPAGRGIGARRRRVTSGWWARIRPGRIRPAARGGRCCALPDRGARRATRRPGGWRGRRALAGPIDERRGG